MKEYYKYSTDYVKLFQWVMKGYVMLGQVITASRIPMDIVKIHSIEGDVIIENTTGKCYSYTYATRPNHEADFIEDCKKLNLMWIENRMHND